MRIMLNVQFQLPFLAFSKTNAERTNGRKCSAVIKKSAKEIVVSCIFVNVSAIINVFISYTKIDKLCVLLSFVGFYTEYTYT